LGLGGLERMVYSLSRCLNGNERFKVLVATYDHPEDGPSLARRFEESGIPLLQWRKGTGFSFRNVFRLFRIVSSGDSWVIHAHDLGPLIYGSLAKILSGGRIRLILTLHTLLDIQGTSRYRFYYKVFLRFPDKIIAVSPGVKAGLLEFGVNPSRLEVIPNGVSFPRRGKGDDAALRSELLPGAPGLIAARWILCLARIHPGKGQEQVLEVWRSLPPRARAECALLFVGQETHPGRMDFLRAAAKESPDGDRIVVVGPSNRPEDWLRAADVFISGSTHEGMPLAPLEAAGSGIPTVLSDIEGHRFLAPWARFFDPADPAAGALKLMEALGSDERAERDAEKGWLDAEPLRRRWDVAVMSDSYSKVLTAGPCNLPAAIRVKSPER
jgi:glycosyltransferase involved in cell wall biosynthesis